jgi:hypothetical protein
VKTYAIELPVVGVSEMGEVVPEAIWRGDGTEWPTVRVVVNAESPEEAIKQAGLHLTMLIANRR